MTAFWKVGATGASLLLVACSGASEAPPPQDASDTAVSQTMGMQPGLYATGDGTQIYSRTRINADGTYVDLNDAMEPVANGTWEQREELLCFDPEGDGEDQQEMCWTSSEPQEDGSVISTSVDGSMSYTVTPIEEPEAVVSEAD